MRLAITGAGGFVGRAVVRQLEQCRFPGEVRLYDRAFDGQQSFSAIAADLCDRSVLDDLAAFADCVIHLVALPGAAAAADPGLSRRVNLDLPLNLLERMKGKRVVYASSIAVLGGDLRDKVTDVTPARPDSTYGTHKHKAELAFADSVRRGALSGLALRLPGVVARPPGAAAGFGSAFLSEVFHAARTGADYLLPVEPDATSWLISAEACAANLVHAATADTSLPQAITMPALTVRMADLLLQLGIVGDVRGIGFHEQPAIRRAFGSYPELTTDRATELGLRADADIAQLVARVFANG